MSQSAPDNAYRFDFTSIDGAALPLSA